MYKVFFSFFNDVWALHWSDVWIKISGEIGYLHLKNLFGGLRHVVITEHHWTRAVVLKGGSLDRISINVAWGLVTNADSPPHPRQTEWEAGVGVQQSILTSPRGDSEAPLSMRATDL